MAHAHTPTDEKPYPTDEFGRPDGRNYQYKIHLDDERAWRKVRVAEKVCGRWIEREDHHLFGWKLVRTLDNKGPIAGLGKEYQHSVEWEPLPCGPGKWEQLEMKNARGGGTRIKGPVYTGEVRIADQVTHYVGVDVTVEHTPTEITAAYEDGENEDEVIGDIAREISWDLDARIDELREERYDELPDDWEPPMV